jgi:hypothetical protein
MPPLRSSRSTRPLRLNTLAGTYAICRAPAGTQTAWATGDLAVVARSRSEAMETTIICDESQVPADIEHDGGWRALRFAGAFDFNEVGVLAGVLATLAEAQVPVMTISTFETDYLLIKAHRFGRVRQVLEEAGHRFDEPEDRA